MEIEGNKAKLNQKQKKLEVSDVLREAVMIYFRNLNFIIFTFLTSLPLLFIMLYFEIHLQEILLETSLILNQPHAHSIYHHGFNPDSIMRIFNMDYVLKLIHLGFIYMVPLHLFELGSAIFTIDLASKQQYSEEKKVTLNLKEIIFQKPLDLSNLRGTFVTSIYVLFLTTTHQLGLLWIVINYHVFLKDLSCYMLFFVICSLVFAKVLRTCLEWSAMWNMSLVISVLERVYGVDALALSVYFSRGCHRRGLFLMLIFFSWGHLLRLSCHHLIGEQGTWSGFYIQVGLFCLVNPLKWVVFMIYFHDCKERSLEKKTDEELGKDVKVVSE